MKNIFEQLADLLKKDERLVSQDGALLKNQAQELARKNDSVLIKLLLSDKAIKQHFFFNVGEVLIFDKEKFIRFISNKQFLPDSYNANKELNDLFKGEIEFENPKPEQLLQHIISITTKENDLVLDFFSGSGTTLAVAHKRGRQYIGVEQMDYIHDLPESRLKKVIAGEQGGISKAVNWQGGGDFVYMELAEWNEKIVKKVRGAKSVKELIKIWSELKENTFLSWKVDLKIFDANAKDFADLSIADQKKFLIECLDKNQLYVNLSEIEDKEYGITKEDVAINKNFYNGK